MNHPGVGECGDCLPRLTATWPAWPRRPEPVRYYYLPAMLAGNCRVR